MSSSSREYGNRIMDYLFYPKSVAVIGASGDNEKELRTGWTGRLKQFGYSGQIYPINPNAQNILGFKAYPTIGNVPGDVEYAIVGLRASQYFARVESSLNNSLSAQSGCPITSTKRRHSGSSTRDK